MSRTDPTGKPALPGLSNGASVPQPSAVDSHPPQIPDHELLQPIASGAYGEVWLARNAVGTLRAVKIVRRDAHANAESFEREFKGLQKFEPVSRTHEGLVDILTLGLLPDGAGFYYVMELADHACGEKGQGGKGEKESITPEASDGREITVPSAPLPPFSPASYAPRTLRAELKSRGALPADEVIALGLKLIAALAHLHGHGLVHRDVKPSNILFIGGEPKLADAGLVAAVDEARSLVGTAGYIAPEGTGTPQADLYALGKVLYEAAFGKDRQEFPALPADVASRPDHARLLELNAVLLKACAADSRERYQSADELRADLEFLDAGHSVKRRQVWQRTKHLAIKLAAAGAALAVVATIVYSLLPGRPRPEDVGWSKNEKANDAYRQGMRAFHQNAPDSFATARRHFEDALSFDPDFPRALAGMEYALAWSDPDNPEVLAKARPYAERALELEPRLDEAHAAVAAIKTLLTHDWKGAEREALKAIRLNPNSDGNYYCYAGLLGWMGRHDEALKQVENASHVSSPSFVSEQFAAWVYLGARQYDQAIRLMNEILGRNESNRARLSWFLVQAYRGKGDYLKAIELEKESDLLSAKNPDAVKARYDALENAFTARGPDGYWQKRLERDKNGTNLVWLATLYARVDDKENAFHYLDLAAETMPTQLCFVINREPGFDSLRSDLRFAKVLKKFGLDQIPGK